MTIKVTGLDEQIARFEAIAARLRDMRPILAVVAEDTKTLIDDAFDTSVSPEGEPWRGLSDTTVSISPRRANGKPLVDTALTRNSITTSVGPGGFSFGTNKIQAATHQFGRASNRVFGKAPGPIPARPFLPITGARGAMVLSTRGKAGEHWARMRADVERWIATGEIAD